MSYSAIGTGTRFENTLHPISHGIHSLVQPLTAAQCLLEFTLHKGGDEEHYRTSIEKALGELRRISDSINFVRELIRIQQDGMDVISFPLKAAVNNVIVELQAVLEDAGVKVFVSESKGEPVVTMSPMRLRQALFYQLQAAQLMCAPGETLLVSIETGEDMAELRIERFDASSRQMNPAGRDAKAGDGDRISQACHLADAIVTKAGGEFNFTDSPLSLVSQFPCSAGVGSSIGESARPIPFPSES